MWLKTFVNHVGQADKEPPLEVMLSPFQSATGSPQVHAGIAHLIVLH